MGEHCTTLLTPISRCTGVDAYCLIRAKVGPSSIREIVNPNKELVFAGSERRKGSGGGCPNANVNRKPVCTRGRGSTLGAL